MINKNFIMGYGAGKSAGGGGSGEYNAKYYTFEGSVSRFGEAFVQFLSEANLTMEQFADKMTSGLGNVFITIGGAGFTLNNALYGVNLTLKFTHADWSTFFFEDSLVVYADFYESDSAEIYAFSCEKGGTETDITNDIKDSTFVMYVYLT